MTYLGTHYLNVDVDIEAGEEISSTDGVIELQSLEYEENELLFYLDLEDFIDVDVSLSDYSLDDEDSIEAILPNFSNQVFFFF